jgi:hypothetical protein
LGFGLQPAFFLLSGFGFSLFCCLVFLAVYAVYLRRWPFLVLLAVCWRCLFGCLPIALAFPCFVIGLFALPLCGAAPTFLCRRKEK